MLHTLARALLGSRAHYQSLLDHIATLRGIPVLIIWGLKDSFFKPHYLARWQQLLPEAVVVTLPGAGHWPHEEEPARVVEALERFLN